MTASPARRSDNPPAVANDDTVVAARRGDPGALRALYERHAAAITRRLAHATGDEDVARDLTQDTFVTAFSRLDRFRGDATLSTWLHAIAFNHLRDHRKRMRTKRSAWDRLRRRPALAPATPAESLEQHEDLERLQQAIASLPPAQCDAFVLRVVEQLSLEESSAILGVRPATISYRARRAEALVRASFEQSEPRS